MTSMPYSELTNAVPLEERIHLPDNKPATYPDQDLAAAPVDPLAANPPALDHPAPNPPHHPQGQVPDEHESIDPLLVEIPQRAYNNGLFHNDAPTQYISYGPSGFTVSNVLVGNHKEVVDPDNDIPTTEGRTWPTKMVFHFEFENAAHGALFHLPQQNVRMKRGDFALRAAQEIEKMLMQRPQFPFTLNQLKVVGIHVHSRGTVQAWLCVLTEDWDAQFAEPEAATDTWP